VTGQISQLCSGVAPLVVVVVVVVMVVVVVVPVKNF
jgi:hypothetical protein